jgi:hypothetical protein
MIGMKLDKTKTLFFDRKKVISAVDRATRRVLSKFGAFVRTRARSSIRRRKGSAPPGQPPHSHTGLLRRLIFFAFEPVRKSVVIGPTLASNKSGEAPRLLEHGGTTTLVRRRKRVRINFRGRPYMGPAFEREKPQLPKLWRDSIRP